MNKPKDYFGLTVLAILFIVGVCVYFLIPKSIKEIITPKTVSETPCTETATRRQGLDIFTCIDGEWIYTGQYNDFKG
jgi:hypothetical protein